MTEQRNDKHTDTKEFLKEKEEQLAQLYGELKRLNVAFRVRMTMMAVHIVLFLVTLGTDWFGGEQLLILTTSSALLLILVPDEVGRIAAAVAVKRYRKEIKDME